MTRTSLIALSALVFAACGSKSANCLDGGVDGGCAGSTYQPPNPAVPQAWDVYVDAFHVQVDITNLMWSDGFCTMSGGAVSSAFTLPASAVGTMTGGISWDPQTHANLSIEFPTESNANVGTQTGQKDPGVPLTCGGATLHYTTYSYRIEGAIDSLTGSATMTSSMPEDGATTNNVGCPPQGDTCHVNYWFDNSPGVATTSLDLGTLLTTGHVVMPIAGTAMSVPSNGASGTGDYHWTGSVTLRAVPR